VSGEKNRPPTAKRLREAAKEGQLAQTPTIPHLLAAVGTFELLAGTSSLWLQQVPLLLGSFIGRLGETSASTRLRVQDLVVPLGGMGLIAILTALLLASLLAMIGFVMQSGFVVAPGAIARIERLNPISHAVNMLTREQFASLLMNCVKVTAIVACTFAGMMMSLDSLLRLADGTLMQAAQAVIDMLVLCERLTLLVLIICAVLDWVIRRQAHIRQLRMSRQEVEAEQKDHYGDKHVRKQRQEFRRDLLAGELTETTRQANAVVTNPTHFAVALLYDPSKYPLPVVLARGADNGAALIRKVAQEAGIPVIRSARLARVLYSVGREWHPVPRIALKAVAAVYRVVAEIRTGERAIGDVVELEDDIIDMTQPGPPVKRPGISFR
jgi:type III secretion protein U